MVMTSGAKARVSDVAVRRRPRDAGRRRAVGDDRPVGGPAHRSLRRSPGCPGSFLGSARGRCPRRVGRGEFGADPGQETGEVDSIPVEVGREQRARLAGLRAGARCRLARLRADRTRWCSSDSLPLQTSRRLAEGNTTTDWMCPHIRPRLTSRPVSQFLEQGQQLLAGVDQVRNGNAGGQSGGGARDGTAGRRGRP
jgi:hypothetical protein